MKPAYDYNLLVGLKPSEAVVVLRFDGFTTYEAHHVIRVMMDTEPFTINRRMRIVPMYNSVHEEEREQQRELASSMRAEADGT